MMRALETASSTLVPIAAGAVSLSFPVLAILVFTLPIFREP
jgi:hypothetical protein